MIWNSRQLEEALKIRIPLEIRANEVQFNSKDVKLGDLFIALKGENSDGHLYAADAINRGAGAVILCKEVQNLPTEKIIKVLDTMEALNLLAHYKRNKSKAKFVAITGSVGKTSTKEAVKLMLQPFGKVFASRGNFNNYLGLPINLASLPDDVDFAVFELGMNHQGEIRELTKIVKPDIAVITIISEAHLQFFNSLNDIADAKCEIFEGLVNNGIAIINRDSQSFDRILFNLNKMNIHNIASFSAIMPSDCRLELYQKRDKKIYLEYSIKSERISITLPALPEHQAKNFAAGFMVVRSFNLDVTKAAKQLEQFVLTAGRGLIVEANKGAKKYQVICDYYNASPESLKASLQYLKLIEHPKKVAIIGDMRELGETAPKLHHDLVPYIVDAGVSKALLVGENVKFIEDNLPATIFTKRFINVDELISDLANMLGDDELILIKGSLGIGLKKVMEYFDKNKMK